MRISAATLHFELSGIASLPLSRQTFEGLETLLDRSEPGSDTFHVQLLHPENEDAFPFTPELIADRVSESGVSLAVIDAWYSLSIDWHAGDASLLLHPPHNDFDGCLCQALNALLCMVMLRRRGFGLHAAGLHYRSNAVVIAGRSGAGKTTLSTALSPPCILVDDDFSLIYPDGDHYWLTGSPFGKDGRIRASKNVRVALKKVYFPFKASQASCRKLSVREAYAAAARNAYGLPAGRSLSEQLMDNLLAFSRSVAAYSIGVDCGAPATTYLTTLFEEDL